jgi:hypothetical protein
LETKKIWIYFSAFLFFFSALIYSQLLSSNYVGDIDAYLVSDIESVTSLSDYIQKWKNNKIHDIQPIRDLTYFMDSYLSKYIGFKTYHLTNIIIWLLICYSVFIITLKFVILPNPSVLLLLMFYLGHPLFIKSVSHLGARKHLLAYLFILLCFNQIIKNKSDLRSNIKTHLFFLLSILSHPMNVLMPLLLAIYYWFYKKMSIKIIIKKTSILGLISLVFALLNLWWYLDIVQDISGVSRYSNENDIGDRLLAIGRYVSFMFLPVNFSSFYGKGSILTLVGLFLLPAVFYIFNKLLSTQKMILLLLAFIFSIFPVIQKLLWTFVSESYFLSGSFIFFIGLLLCIKNRKIKLFPLVIMVVFVLFNIFQSFITINDFTNEERYFRTSYENDQNCTNLIYYTEYLFKVRDIDNASLYGNEMVQRKCYWFNKSTQSRFTSLFAKVLIYSKSDKESREELLINITNSGYYLKLHLALFYLKDNQHEKFHEILKEGIKHNVQFKKDSFFIQKGLSFCKDETHPACADLRDVFSQIK